MAGAPVHSKAVSYGEARQAPTPLEVDYTARVAGQLACQLSSYNQPSGPAVDSISCPPRSRAPYKFTCIYSVRT